MKESIGNAFVLGIFITFAFLTMLILMYAINYSRASKIKNSLVNYVQTYAESNPNIDFSENEEFTSSVNTLLSDVGYRINNNLNQFSTSCKDLNDGSSLITLHSYYDYCIYKYETSRGPFYRIVTYMYFDIPIIGNTLKFPISGETRTIYSLTDK